jgi:hypothetical protein
MRQVIGALETISCVVFRHRSCMEVRHGGYPAVLRFEKTQCAQVAWRLFPLRLLVPSLARRWLGKLKESSALAAIGFLYNFVC